MKEIPIEELLSLLRYDPDTGILRWITKNTGQPSDVAGNRRPDGYVYVMYKKKAWLGHRLAWAIYRKEWPKSPLDHINMNRSDNRIANLRLASVAENNRNRTAQRNSTTGFKGVQFHKGKGKYEAKITFNKRTRCLGYFDQAEDASIAYQQAAKELHGEFAKY